LVTYNHAKRLAKMPRYAGLAVYVADMRRALGKMRGKETPEQAQKRAAKLAAKAAAKLAAQAEQKPQEPEPAGPAL
jgi:nucleotide-binding universal stress UspA family protein